MGIRSAHALRFEAVSEGGSAALHHLQLFSPSPAADGAWGQGDGGGGVGTDSCAASGASLCLRADARACSPAGQRATSDCTGAMVESLQADRFAEVARAAREVLARPLLRQQYLRGEGPL